MTMTDRSKNKREGLRTYDALQMHRHNRELIFHLYRTREVLSRAELTQITGMSPTAVGKIIADFEEEGLLQKAGVDPEGLGRKAVLYRINPDGSYVIGVEIDRHLIRAGIVDLCGNVRRCLTKDDAMTEDVKETGRVISGMISELLLGMTQRQAERVRGIGISLPGIVEWPEGTVAASPQLEWTNADLTKEILVQPRLPIFVENDVKAEATAEILFGEGKKSPDLYLLKLGSGIGSALVLDNQVIRGHNNIFGEVGHLMLVPGGKQCECGRRGCIEAYCGMLCMEQETGLPFAEILTRSEAGDRVCMELLDQSVTYTAILLSNAVNLYNPPVIVVYGEMLAAWPQFFEKICMRAKDFLWKPDSTRFAIVRSGFDSGTAGILGAASVVLGNGSN